ncbi:TonB family protein [Erwinia billingiae]|uniref:energy transducer TonB n=1 Tax=Erwinia billingiae TaxID=182337 RepID=UPI0030D5726B
MKRIIITLLVFLFIPTASGYAASYPLRAWQLGKSGEVTVKFDVNKLGKAENFLIVKSNPKGFFERSAVDAVKEMAFDKDHPVTGREITIKYEK